MWLIALFDLPTDTPEARRAYTSFRKQLLKSGFKMLQYSVYARYCPSEEKAKVHHNRIQRVLPPDGEVRVMSLTDAQFAKMKIFHGKTRGAPERVPDQIEMF
ncbi:CRISPR-associated endonuclease Cas2 [Solemya pervernicosa gill symbiont]|uniref:CRISPR-associated endoribonuclease Cas2 n=1 Tax=Solemya pervernicosa gill symbiont TaxID=642797 RepID=A0A1T2L223_9GAMM|nr:CRISPR-associated endonuclease Cas2 [Solemya pervernicosa gill symbiont]